MTRKRIQPYVSIYLFSPKGCPGGSEVKNLPAVQEPQETWVQSLSQEDPLEKGMAIHSSTLAWRIPWREEPGGLQSMGSQRVGLDCNDLAYSHSPSDSSTIQPGKANSIGHEPWR